jgi:hypothetical protein
MGSNHQRWAPEPTLSIDDVSIRDAWVLLTGSGAFLTGLPFPCRSLSGGGCGSGDLMIPSPCLPGCDENRGGGSYQVAPMRWWG